MKKIFLCVISFTLFIFWLVTAAQATAISIVNTYAEWDKLNVSGGTEGVDYSSWYSKASLGFANASNNFTPNVQVGPNSINSWGNTSSIREIINAKGNAYTTDSLIAAEAISTSDGYITTSAWSSASTHRPGSLDVIKNSTLSFEMPFSYYHELTAPLIGDHSSAYSQASLVLIYDFNGNGYFDQPDYDNYLDSAIFSYSNDTSGIFQGGDIISVSANLEAGTTYALELHLYSSASTNALERDNPNAVPEPTTMLLICISFFGLTYRRRIY